MAPFDSDIDPTGNLTTKISTLIDGQLPDFIQADHPIFSVFLKQSNTMTVDFGKFS